MPKSSEYLNRIEPKTASELQLVEEGAEDCCTYHPWNADQIKHGNRILEALQAAFEAVISHAPAGPDRSSALRKIREARMDANSAITHGGRY